MFDTLQQKRFAEIAVGKSLESSFHKPLHSKKKKATYEEETGSTDSVRIQRLNLLMQNL